LAINPAYTPFFAVLNRNTYSGMGEAVANDDRRRDNMYSGLYEIIKGMSRFAGEGNLFAGAATLLSVFEKEGAMHQKTYAQQTAAIDRFVADMNLTDNMTILTSLSLVDAFNRLKNMNTHFKNTYIAQVDANSDLRQQGTAGDTRKPLEEALKQFFTLVEAMKATQPWKDLYSDLSELKMRTKF
jgi:hypothetical protein